jgi:formylmethanofuran dehydrogenase subunit C
MKIPKTFVKENISDEDLKKILNIEEDKLFSKHMDRLVSSCDQFLSQTYGGAEVKYEIGEKTANKYIYNLEDVENLSKRILLTPVWDDSEPEILGFYFSAMINKIIKENDTVNLTLCTKLDGIGSRLAKGTVTVDSNAGSWVGWHMTGGKLKILGDIKDYIAYRMEGGIIIVTGKAGGSVGYQANRGELYINEIEGSITMSCMASVYNSEGKKIWPPDQFKMARGKGTID